MTTSKTLIFLAIAVASCVESKHFGPLASIPTHHGIDAAVHLSGGGGGAVATRTKKKVLTVNKAEPIVSTYYQKNEVESASNAVASAPAVPAVTNKDALSPIAIVCMSLLAVQFGIQPILVRRYTPQTIVRSSVVLVQEVVKFVIAGGIYLSGTSKEKRVKDFEGEFSGVEGLSFRCISLTSHSILIRMDFTYMDSPCRSPGASLHNSKH